jgi:RNA polymerase-binding transcription factor DksA
MAAAKDKTIAAKLTKQSAPSKPATRKAGSKAPVKPSAGKVVPKARAKKTVATKVATAKAPVKVEKHIATKVVPRQPVAAKAKPAKPEPAKAARRAPETAVKKPVKAVTPAPKKPVSAATKTTAKSTTNTNVAAMRPKREPEVVSELPKPKFNKDGIGYTKDFELAFVKELHDALVAERIRLTGQANRLESEAKQMIDEAEMGDVQFDDEGGEGDTMVVERERDLALSAQAREAVVEIDEALARIFAGTFGYSVMSGKPLPKERLEAIPWASISVEEKVGGIGRR